MTIIAMDSVESSQIAAIGYDPATNTLAIQFASRRGPGSLYHYANVSPEDFASFRDAESIGSHFYKFIKPFPEKYPYTRIDRAGEGEQA
ncbi:KTSC domain-containing protein [Paraburkholderia sp.]|uniref:KTSC domain-containing protein n=1 Tax=Paraburkholderia sp. TaxID=1926495 RepID=UPI00239444BD|nr:KTSC domain-containing protein [Paraburkholderia sp.]MDE1179455.1 KTSC domain-containing protein [Paraburkholderia sp.]